MYCLFYERGNQLLSKKGALCYITSNKWMRQKYGENLRIYLNKRTDPKVLIDFCETHVFESACVMTNILLFLHQQNQHALCAAQINDDYIETSNIKQYTDEHQVVCSFSGTESWVVRSDRARAIKHKVETQGKPLEKWSLQVYRGILTGYDKAFFIDSATRQEILDNCRTDAERKLGEHISYLTAMFNSSLFKFCFRDDFGTLFGGARTLSKIFFDKIPVKEVSDKIDAEFRTLVLDIQSDYSDEKAKAIDQKIFDLYGLTPEEREAIGYIDIK